MANLSDRSESAEDGRDIFFHRSDLEGTYSGLLEEGTSVEFDVERGSRSLRGLNVRMIQDTPYDDVNNEGVEDRVTRRFDVHGRLDSLVKNWLKYMINWKS